MENKKATNKMIGIMAQYVDNIESAIANIKRVRGTANGIFVQSFDKELFGDKAQEDITNQVYDILLSIVLSESIVIVKDNYVIAVGYANKIEFMTRKEAKQLC